MFPRHRSSLSSLGYLISQYIKEKARQKRKAENDKIEKAIRELGLAPVCKHCRSNSRMKLISWKDKQTGTLKRAYKCEACNRWHYPKSDAK